MAFGRGYGGDVTDSERRANERLAREGDPAARVRLLLDRVRDGKLLPSRLELAAFCHGVTSPGTTGRAAVAAWEALPPPSRRRIGELRSGDEAAWRRELVRLGKTPLVTFLTGAVFGFRDPGDGQASADPLAGREIHLLADATVRFALADPPITFRAAGVDLLEEVDHDGRIGIEYTGHDAASREPVRLVALPDRIATEGVTELADRLRRLDHPSLSRVLRVHMDEGDSLVAIVLRRADGMPLASWLTAPHTLDEKLSLVDEVADALQYLHRRELVHGKLDPGSIRLWSGQPRIYDHAPVLVDRVLAPPYVAKVHEWCAPEVLTDRGKIGFGTDIYGLAALAFHLIEGRPPFSDEGNYMGRLRRILLDPPPRASVKDAVLRRGLAKRPEDRYPSVAAFRQALLEE